ncbi:MAG: hypothetical protein WAX14_10915 [Rhodococcus sp. (in: high G+C Gram-positive bacteria)]|uniref:hypothetical protein n=1 Tax=Rhodococcus sp. TaxID=1831 RepID=UPI003BB4FB2A
MTTTPEQEAANEAGRRATSRLLRTLGPIENKRANAGYPIHPHSSLALDHQRMPGLLVSHSVDRALHHSLDCLWGLDQLLKETGPQHYAPYLLIRGALESAATVIWLLDPDDRTTRLQRRVAIEVNNAKEASKAIAAAGRSDDHDPDRWESDMSALLDSAGLVLKDCQWKGYGAIVREIDAAPQTVRSTELAWRACSGMSHGKFWSLQMFAAESNRRDIGNDAIQADFTPSYHGLAIVLDAVVRTIHHADTLYDTRRKAIL